MLQAQAGSEAGHPNVVLIITDDQGYGDIAAHGNSVIRTPHLDRLHEQSLRLTDYHVDPTCSPTRSALMSGRYSTRTGVWHTILGRSIMRTEELTLGEVFRANGYRTGHFGKWHLGDNYPCRPEDQGFDEVLRHGGGGVGQGPDFWGNDYFGDTCWRNGIPESFEGYCTDVWFEEAMRFIQENRDRRFFVYLTTNAPHSPYRVPENYARPYKAMGLPEGMANFYGMIENIDENVGRLREFLAGLGLAENTVLIFTTDNGTAAGVHRNPAQSEWKGFNAGMRGTKGSEYDGGHRVPFYLHWPAGGYSDGQDIPVLSGHIDVLPTLVELCGLRKPDGPALDGASLVPAFQGERETYEGRVMFVHSQRIQNPLKWRKCSVMTPRWRLMNGVELYNIREDPGQVENVAADFPQVRERLRHQYERWWESLKPSFDEYVRIWLGSQRENPVRLSAHDWHCEESGDCPWHQLHVVRGMIGNGAWSVYVERKGRYRVNLYRWPEHLGRPMNCVRAELELGGKRMTKVLSKADTRAVFEVYLESGPADLTTWLTREDGVRHGAYYVTVQRLGASALDGQ